MLDYIGDGVPVVFTSAVSGGSVVRVEDGVDVVYRVGAVETVKNLRRIRMPSHDIATHTSEHIGRVWTSGSARDMSCAIEYSQDLMFLSYIDTWRFWDIKTAGPTNNWQVPIFDEGPDLNQIRIDGRINETKLCNVGTASCPQRPGVYVWPNGGSVYHVLPPDGNPTPTAGWKISCITSADTTPRPMTGAEIEATPESYLGHVWGKWKYAEDLDCFVGMQHPRNGDVWLWKPSGWADPRGN